MMRASLKSIIMNSHGSFSVNCTTENLSFFALVQAGENENDDNGSNTH